MANFQSHLVSATVVSSLAASSVMSLQLVNPNEVVVLWLLGILGGMLPDIDSDNSTSLALLFNLFALTAALCCASWLYPVLSLVGLWLVAGLTFVLVRFTLMPLFEWLTVHRGTTHSLLACVMFGLAAVQLAILADKSVIFAWCAGIFIIIGMLVHLTMDEIYSVDLANLEFKRSFGTALKPLAVAYPFTTGAHVLVCAGLIYLAPPLNPLIDALQHNKLRFMPWQDWGNLLALLGL